MASYLDVLFYSIVGGVISLTGALLLVGSAKLAAKLTKFATAFAAGALLGVAFFDLLPESIELTAEGAAPRWVLVGLLAFFLLEHSLHWFHHHKHQHEHVKSAAPLIVVGDTVHNFIDGLAIGAAFVINPAVGITTAVAVAAHEIPQEIGDFGILLKAGFSRKKVIIINLLSSLATVIGALLAFRLGSSMDLPLGELLAITAGMFIYVAASDLIPDIHEQAKGRIAKLPALLLILGVLVVGVITDIAHEKIHETEHGHTESSQHDDHHEEEADHHEHEH